MQYTVHAPPTTPSTLPLLRKQKSNRFPNFQIIIEVNKLAKLSLAKIIDHKQVFSQFVQSRKVLITERREVFTVNFISGLQTNNPLGSYLSINRYSQNQPGVIRISRSQVLKLLKN